MVYTTKKDFIKRTLELIDQYEIFRKTIPPREQHESTLFANCLMGLLIIAKEEYLAKIPTGIAITSIAGTEIDVSRMLITALRNSIAHYDFDLKDMNGDEIIDAIEFKNIGIFDLFKFKPFIKDFAKALYEAIPD